MSILQGVRTAEENGRAPRIRCPAIPSHRTGAPRAQNNNATRTLREENTALRAELASLRAENQALLEQLRQLQQRLSGTEGPEPGPEPDAESSTNV